MHFLVHLKYQTSDSLQSSSFFQDFSRQLLSFRAAVHAYKFLQKHGGFSKLCSLSPQLQEFIVGASNGQDRGTPSKLGESYFNFPSYNLVWGIINSVNFLSFFWVVKQLRTHAREKNLQDPSDRRNINCDKPLQALFGVDSIKMFQMSYE